MTATKPRAVPGQWAQARAAIEIAEALAKLFEETTLVDMPDPERWRWMDLGGALVTEAISRRSQE